LVVKAKEKLGASSTTISNRMVQLSIFHKLVPVVERIGIATLSYTKLRVDFKFNFSTNKFVIIQGKFFVNGFYCETHVCDSVREVNLFITAFKKYKKMVEKRFELWQEDDVGIIPLDDDFISVEDTNQQLVNEANMDQQKDNELQESLSYDDVYPHVNPNISDMTSFCNTYKKI